MSDYLKTYYTNKMRPVTDYPFKLAEHISQKYLDASHKKLLDLGCGTGQNTINYDWKGARCTLVEYDKKSYIQAHYF